MVVGLTGGIGSGKTTVAAMFSKLGVPVYNSDIEAKQLMLSSKTLKKEIIALLGSEAYKEEKLNKTFISNKIFNDKSLLKKLNIIVHPVVRTHFLAWVKKQEYPYVIQETALIFENEMQSHYDKIILIKANAAVRLDRVKKRDASSVAAVKAKMKNQLDDVEKEKLSDYIINNIQLDQTYSAVVELHKKILSLSTKA